MSRSRRQFSVIKATGESDLFSLEKLKGSLRRSGASEAQVVAVAEALAAESYEGIHTRQIYKKAFVLLRRLQRPAAARYKLKAAMLELGPSGYLFELYMAELLKHKGFQTQVGVIYQGRCVQHEVDIVADKADLQLMIECKFRNKPGYNCDVKVPLYIDSRFRDIRHYWERLPGNDLRRYEGWIYTNTRFSSDAVKYARCVGLNLISWDYPEGDGLRHWIDSTHLYPVTVLTSLTQAEKQHLLAQKILLCQALYQAPEILHQTGLSLPENRLKGILAECEQLCQGL